MARAQRLGGGFDTETRRQFQPHALHPTHTHRGLTAGERPTTAAGGSAFTSNESETQPVTHRPARRPYTPEARHRPSTQAVAEAFSDLCNRAGSSQVQRAEYPHSEAHDGWATQNSVAGHRPVTSGASLPAVTGASLPRHAHRLPPKGRPIPHSPLLLCPAVDRHRAVPVRVGNPIPPLLSPGIEANGSRPSLAWRGARACWLSQSAVCGLPLPDLWRAGQS